MAMMPKRVKFRKVQKGRIRGNATRGNYVAFGDFVLQSMEPGRLTSRQIEAARMAITRHVKRAGKLWIRIFPDHPVTKHLAVAYWRGGDEALESRIYQPHNIEKICAWGGFASVKHVTKYIQPGIELISLDPKRSAGIVGA